MKPLYFFTLVLMIFTSCKSEEEKSKKISAPQSSTTSKEAEKRLDDEIAHTEKVWDSLENILQRKDLDDEYRNKLNKLFLENKEEQLRIYKNFIQQNPDSEISVGLLNGFKFNWEKETTKKLYNLLIPELQNSENGQKVEKFITYFNNPKLNDQYTNFELKSLKGDIISISDYRKDYTLLEFWASWCGPCRKKHPQLIELYEKYKDKGFTVIGISGDQNESDWKTAVEQDKLSWINLIDTGGRDSEVQYQYGITMLPTNFLIAPDGKIVAIDISTEELEVFLQKSIDETAHKKKLI